MGESRTPIEALGLGARAEKALRQLGVSSIEKLLALDASRVLDLRGCGHGVYQRLLSAQQRLHVENHTTPGSRIDPSRTFSVLKLSTGSWAQRCLAELGARNLYDLAAVRFVDFLDLEGFGLSTWGEIAAVRRQALEALGGIVVGKRRKTVKDPAMIYSRPPTFDSLLLLPLFSALEPSFFGIPEFHPDWCADWRVTDLALSVRAFALCDRAGVKTLGRLLVLPGTTFLSERNSHFGTLRTVHQAVKSLLLGGLQDKQRTVDYSSFRAMIRTWLEQILHEFFARVVLERFEVEDDRFVTYERISQKFDITRARVGQICDTARLELCRRQHLLVIDRFWQAVRGSIRNGSLRMEALAEVVAGAMGWDAPPPVISLRELVSYNHEFSLARHRKLVRLRA